jgi:hypothetical protein
VIANSCLSLQDCLDPVSRKLISFVASFLVLPDLIYGPPCNPKNLEIKGGFVKEWVKKRPDLNRASWNLENIAFTVPSDLNQLHVFSFAKMFPKAGGSRPSD